MTADELRGILKDNGWSYKELADKIGYTESAICQALKRSEISTPMARACELLLDNEKLQRQSGESAEQQEQTRQKAAAFDFIIKELAKEVKKID